ncbi:MAG: metallophosphoesterase family protein [Syntrophales bacterium]
MGNIGEIDGMAAFGDRCVGLIADSHGNLDATAEAIRLLKARGADTLFHLGDFCDSVRHDRAAAMISLLRKHGVLAVKGNNDFFVESMLTDERRASKPEEKPTVAFLRGVPFTRKLDGLLFAHSLPYDSFRSFYEPIDTGTTRRAERLFAETDFQLLFCGHSHLPILFRKAGATVTREQVPPEVKLVLGAADDPPDAGEERLSAGQNGDGNRFIVVVGSADEGECALYDRKAGVYERIRIFPADPLPKNR